MAQDGSAWQRQPAARLLTYHIATNVGSLHVVFQYGSGARFALCRSDRMSPGTVAASDEPLAVELMDAPPTTFTAVQAPSRYTGADDEAMEWSRSVTGSACCPNATPTTSAMNRSSIEVIWKRSRRCTLSNLLTYNGYRELWTQ